MNVLNKEYLHNVYFNAEQIKDLEISLSLLLDQYVEENPLFFNKENYMDELDNFVLTNVLPLFDIELIEEMENLHYEKNIIYLQIKDIYQNIKKYNFTQQYPVRSFSKTFIRKYPNVDVIKEKISIIRNKYQPEQKSDEWYMFRHKIITASSAWKIFKTQSYINQIILEKCKPFQIEKYHSFNIESPLHHGQKYEPLSIMFYEKKFETTVEDFGCILHDDYSYLGASPDGINIDYNSDRYGRMLEIKNPTSREITGIPKEDYWIQMQLQMETCNLNECDFLETSFKEYDNEEEFLEDGSFEFTKTGKLKGIIIHFIKDEKPLYEYMPLYCTKSEYDKWFENIIDKNSHLTWVKNIYWRLEKYSCVLVLRNKFWFSHAIKKIEEVWKIIEQEKITGYEHRLPKKITRSRSNSLPNMNNVNKKCLINISDLLL